MLSAPSPGVRCNAIKHRRSCSLSIEAILQPPRTAAFGRGRTTVSSHSSTTMVHLAAGHGLGGTVAADSKNRVAPRHVDAASTLAVSPRGGALASPRLAHEHGSVH